MAEQRGRQVEFTIKPPLKMSQLPAPEAANYFNITFSGPEVQLLVGYVDLRHLLPRAAGHKLDIEPEVTHRMMVSLRAFMLLRNQMNEIWEKMKATGMIEEETK